MEVIKATEADASTVKTLFLRMLAEISRYEVYDIKSSEKNAELLTNLLISKNEGGCQIAIDEETQKAIGATFWYGAKHCPSLDITEGLVACAGTYVAPQWRRKGVSKALREKASQELREAGYTELRGSVSVCNEDSNNSMPRNSMVIGFIYKVPLV